jgi:hypothetical protein
MRRAEIRTLKTLSQIYTIVFHDFHLWRIKSILDKDNNDWHINTNGGTIFRPKMQLF